MKNSGQIIGFAEQYYTLWSYTNEIKYTTDAYGKHWPAYSVTHYNYLKNISTDIGKVTEAHPDLEIDEGLRGVRRSFIYENTKEDLSPELLKFGKYCGRTIYEIENIDFNYLLWLMDNAYKPQLSELIAGLPKVVEHLQRIEQKKLDELNRIKSSFLTKGRYDIRFDRNPYNYFYETISTFDINWDVQLSDELKNELGSGSNKLSTVVEMDGIRYELIFRDYRRVESLYPHNMPMVNGVFKRVKNKTFNLNLTPVGFTYIDNVNEPMRQILLVD